MKPLLAAAAALLAALALAAPSAASAQASILPCTGTETVIFTSGDDVTLQVSLAPVWTPAAPLRFGGLNFSDMFINSNGNVTFGNGYTSFTPSALPGLSQPTIAPHFADVDVNNGGRVLYCVEPANGRVLVTWEDASYYGGPGTGNRNTYQLVLTAATACSTDSVTAQFRYEQLEFYVGTASGGNSEGLCDIPQQPSCVPAVAGVDYGDTMTATQLPGSLTTEVNNVLLTMTNTGTPGVWEIDINPSAVPTCNDNMLDICEECDTGGETVACDDDCTFPSCGDGNLNEAAGEECDDGDNTPGDGCDAACRIEIPQVCGNSMIEGTETCDDGNASAGDGCDASCQQEPGFNCPGAGLPCTPICGDSITVTGEDCDDGGVNTATCDADCTTPMCGDGTTNVPAGEDCDDSGVNTAMCDADCTTPTCGDGDINVPAGETCDDGNTADFDGCSSACLVEIQMCGNGGIETPEQCDDGNMSDMDGCSAACTVEPGYRCSCATPTFTYSDETLAGRLGGDGGGAGPQMGCTGNDILIGLAVNWSDSRGEAVRTRAICGAVSVDVGGAVTTTQTTTEESGGTGCGGWDPSTWSPEIVCPTGMAIVGLRGLASDLGGTVTLFDDASIVCQPIGVDGNPAGSTVTLPIPGGGQAGAGGPQTVDCPSGTIARFFQTRSGCAQDALDLFCGVPAGGCDGELSICDAQCGDSVVAAPTEDCDDGNDVAGDGCDATCNTEPGYTCGVPGAPCTTTCGDSITAGAEDCDEGGVDTATCDADCTAPMCGDLTVNAAASEDCDEGGVETATCDADCTAPTCGDGDLNELAGEACDDGNDVAGDGCSDTCQNEACGNSVVDAAEECDEGGVDTATCDANCTFATCGDGSVNAAADETCDEGAATATCDDDCTAPECGDGTLNPQANEVCDDGSANSNTEPDACRTSCIEAACGDGVVDTGEECDGDASCNVDCTLMGVDAGPMRPDAGPPRTDAGGVGADGGGTADAGTADAGDDGFGLSGGGACAVEPGRRAPSSAWLLALALGALLLRRRQR